MPLGTEVDLGPGDIVLDRDPAPSPTERGTAAPIFRVMSIVAKRSPISATGELLSYVLVLCLTLYYVFYTYRTFTEICFYLRF